MEPTPHQELIKAPDYFYDEFGNQIAYEIKDIVLVEPFKVLWSANAWWLDMGKVQRLMESFKRSYTVNQACVFAGISYDQWVYFNEKHPQFSQVKERCKEVTQMFAKKTLADAATKDWKAALSLLQVREPESYGLQRAMGGKPSDAPPSMGSLVTGAFFDESGELALNGKMTKYLADKGKSKPQ